MKKLYRFELDYGRMGSLDGLFIEDEQKVKDIIGKEVYFGEVLGKHSEVYSDMREYMFEAIDLPQDVIEMLEEKVGASISGFNPIEIKEEHDADMEDDDA